MFKRITVLLLLMLTVFAQQAWAQMTDAQIVEYIVTNVAAGKTERQIANELFAKGVSTSQIQQLLRQYRNATGSSVSAEKETTASVSSSQVSRNVAQPSQEDINDRLFPQEKKKKVKQSTAEKENQLFDSLGRKRIYGMEIFSSRRLSFEPNQNQATPEDYVLGPGDELIITIYGTNEMVIRQTISPEGTINVTQVGPIVLSGLTIKEAKGKLKTSLSKTYSSLRSGASHLILSLGAVRTIQVNVLGEVTSPGTYRLSAFSTVFHALYRAGGITEIGSLREVMIRRGGKDFVSVDVYSYIFGGETDVNASLKEGDVVYVPAYQSLVGIDGFVKRPMFYELKKDEPLQALVDYAGGFSEGAWSEEIQVERKDGQVNRMFSVKHDAFDSFRMKDGDVAQVVGNDLDLFANRVTVEGAVYRPGNFQLGGDIATVKQLVEHAGGLLPNAYMGRAELLREKADRSLERRSVPIKGIMEGLVEDIVLRNNDILVVSDVNELEPKGDLTITGEVNNPGEYPYAEHTTVEDLIIKAGGLAEGASLAKVEVSRRIEDPTGTQASNVLAQVFSLSIKDGLLDAGAAGFELKPYDIVSIRKSPNYQEQRNVTISGEVNFPGQYTLQSTQERVSQLLERAGGVTPNGNIRGAMVRRQITPYERIARRSLARMAAQTVSSKDSLNKEKLRVAELYTVGLELDKALANPGSDYDMILRDGDELIIPEMITTVRIQGEVLYPNAVQYVEGKPVSYYIKQAGGFTTQARRSQLYVVYLNGTVAVGNAAKLAPGCEIVVPARAEHNKLTTGEWLAIGTSASAIVTMVATIANLIKNNHQ